MSPYTDAAEAMKYLGVPDQPSLLQWEDHQVTQDTLQAVVLAVANKLEAVEQRLAAIAHQRS